MKKSYAFAGLLIFIVGLTLTFLHDYPINVESYEQRGYTKNTYQSGELLTTVSGNFNAGERLFFNFTRGRYWTGVEEPFEPGFDVTRDVAIPPHKIVTFVIQTPSSQNCTIDVYVVEGESTFMVVFEDRVDDLEPLPNGNLTFQNVGVECLVKKNGTYTVQAYSIVPPIYKTMEEVLTLEEDPPRIMALWCIKNVTTYPYQFLLPFGLFLIFLGLVLGTWGLKGKRRRSLTKIKNNIRKRRR
jgi:hypothetical protein